MTRLGKYELHELIGQGGFGVVYRATDTSLGRVVALKVLHSQLLFDPAQIERFQKEARIVAALDHPNIVAIYEAGEAEGRYYLAMKYLGGGSLKDRLAQGRLSFQQAAQVIQEVCEGLQEAHARGWVHRDLKPANILFDGRGRAVVTDFGLARALSLVSGSSSSLGGVGTPFYRAPELWRGKPPASPATDVYALGCILAEMLTGRAIFTGETPDQVMYQHIMEGPDFGANWPPNDTPGGAVQAVERALQKNPPERYSDAQGFASALMQGARAAEQARAPERAVATLKRPAQIRGEHLWVTLAPGVEMEFVRVPEGEFWMGSDQGRDDERPCRKVWLDAYWIGRYPVTCAQYAAFVKAARAAPPAGWKNGQIPPGKDQHPVVNVSWQDVQDFCEWAGLRLPSEAQWEKAARGVHRREYPWGNEPPDEKCCNGNGWFGDTTPVGQFSPVGDSPYGCADMAGNVWEWVNDWYQDDYYRGAPSRNPPGPANGSARVVRGGGWDYDDYGLRAAYRNLDLDPTDRAGDLGFRCGGSPVP